MGPDKIPQGGLRSIPELLSGKIPPTSLAPAKLHSLFGLHWEPTDQKDSEQFKVSSVQRGGSCLGAIGREQTDTHTERDTCLRS